MVNAVLGWLLSVLEAALDLWPDLSVSWPDLQPLVHPLEEINYLVPIGPLFSFVLGVLVLFPLFLGVSLSFWLYGLVRGGGAK